MKCVYLLMGKRPSPIYITQPHVYGCYECREEAKTEADRRNASNRTINEYWVERAPMKMKQHKESKS